MKNIIFTMLIALLCNQGVSKAETWPTLEDYVAKCVLIIKTKAIVEDNKSVSFELLETWKGSYDPGVFTRKTPEGRYFSFQNVHGVVNIFDGQEVVLFFTDYNQITKGKFSHHSTAMPVADGKVVYAPTSWNLSQRFTLQGFKDKVVERVKEEEDLMKRVKVLSLVQLRILKSKVDQQLENANEAERKKWNSRAVSPPQESVQDK